MCQANLQPRVGRERQKVSGQFMKSDRLAGGEVVSEGSALPRKKEHWKKGVSPRPHSAVLIETTTCCWKKTEKARCVRAQTGFINNPGSVSTQHKSRSLTVIRRKLSAFDSSTLTGSNRLTGSA